MFSHYCLLFSGERKGWGHRPREYGNAYIVVEETATSQLVGHGTELVKRRLWNEVTVKENELSKGKKEMQR